MVAPSSVPIAAGGTFWAASASWNIHNEAFMQDIKNVLNVLKLRYSYGVNGNDNIAAYAHYGLYSDIVLQRYHRSAPLAAAEP